MFNTKHEIRRAPYCLPLAVLCLLSCLPARAAIALVSHAYCFDSGDSGSCTTSTINTTGATLLTVVIEGYNATGTVSDHYANSWNYLTTQSVSGVGHLTIAYAYGPAVGASETFTCSVVYAGCKASAWSGTLTTSSVYDTQNGASSSSATSLATGSITPAQTGELILSGWGTRNNSGQGGTAAVTASLTILDCATVSTGDADCDAYLVDSNSSGINPTWSWNSAAEDFEVAIAGFKPSGAAPPTCGQSIALMGVGCR